MKPRKIKFYLALILTFSDTIVAKISFKPIKSDYERNVENIYQLVEKFFPDENNLCVVKLGPIRDISGEDKNLPNFHVPVVVYDEDQILCDCDGKLLDYNGYVFMTSNSTNIEVHLFPVLKCLNRTTLKIKTKHMLVLDSSKDRTPFVTYENLFIKLWKDFGITNIAIYPVQEEITNAELPFIIYFNPFFAYQYSNASALMISFASQNLRRALMDRFRNMHGYPLKTLFFHIRGVNLAVEDLKKVPRLGDSPSLIFTLTLIEYLNASLDVYAVVNHTEGDTFDKGTVVPLEEVINGNADHCIPGSMAIGNWPKQIQIIQIGYSFKFIFIVPQPRQVESWRLFLYIFQWEVSVGLGLTLLVLSGAAILFVVLISKTNKHSDGSDATSQVVVVLKASISASINKLPEKHSQRLLVAVSLLLGLILITVFSAKLFNLMKSRPKEGCIRTLHKLQDSNLPIYLSSQQYSLIIDTFENTSLSKLPKNLKHDELYYRNWLNPQHLNISDRAILYTDSMVYILMNLRSNRMFLKYFEVISEPISESSLAMIYPIGSVYNDHINELNTILSAGGFHDKWYAASTDKYISIISNLPTTHAQLANDENTDDDKVPLTYDDLKLAFYILYVGLIVSTMCFGTEVLLKKLARTK